MHNWIHTVAVLVQVISAIGVIILVLLQHGKGADMGAAFGSGASGSLFGATGSANFLSRSTGVLATVFLISTLALSFLSNDSPRAADSLMQGVTTPASPASQVPVTVPPVPGPADVPSVPSSNSPTDPSVPSVPAPGGSAAPAVSPGVPAVDASGSSPAPASKAGNAAASSVPAVPSTPSTSSGDNAGAVDESASPATGKDSKPK